MALEVRYDKTTIKPDSWTGDAWDDEYYWLADETILALVETGLDAEYHQVSSCGGVFEITGQPRANP